MNTEPKVDLDLDAFADPTYTIKVNGEARTYQLFELLPKLKNVPTEVDPRDAAGFAGMEAAREAFGFPRKDSGQPTVSDLRMLRLVNAFTAFAHAEVTSLGESLGQTQNSSGTASARPSSSSSQPTTESPSSEG